MNVASAAVDGRTGGHHLDQPHGTSGKIGYRADIDGLRALAVLPVVLYHAGLQSFQGGFVGVDVFFVISGYLITRLVLAEMANGEFSIGRFYERRVRRILPALFVVIAFSIVGAAVLFVPSDLTAAADSAVAATLSVANLLFWRESGYFSIDSERQPLLHTWSLAVEEQFYLVFPPLLLLLIRYGKARYGRWLAASAVASFVASVVMVGIDVPSAFYLLPMRAWELLLGALLACGAVPAVTSSLWRNIAATIGLLLIAASVFFYTPQTLFPGAAALLPAIGTALVIHSGGTGSSLVERLLAVRPLVGIGLISYSLYLWHWPLLVFARYWSIVDLTAFRALTVIAASFVLAFLSWRCIETPFRTRLVCRTRATLFRFAAVATVGLAAIGLTLNVQRGVLPGLNRPHDAEEVLTAEWVKWGECEQRVDSPRPTGNPCGLGAPTAEPTFLLWGDSHARSLATSVEQSAERFGRAGRIVTKSGCPPLLGIERKNRVACSEFNDRMMQYVRSHPELKTVILASRWALSAEGRYYGREQLSRPGGEIPELVDIYSGRTGSTPAMFELGLRRTIDALRKMNRRVALVAQVPEIGYDVPSAVVVARRTGRDVEALIAPSKALYTRRNERVAALFESLRASGVVEVIDPSAELCDDERCVVTASGAALYRDGHHLSTHGAYHVAPVFDTLFSSSRLFDTVPHSN